MRVVIAVWVRVPSLAPRRRGLRIVRDDDFFFLAIVIPHSLRRSSSPNRTHCVGLRFGFLVRCNAAVYRVLLL